MASRTYNNAQLALEDQVVHLYAKLTIGSSGAVTLTRGKGITGVALTATGKYTFTLDDYFHRLLAVNVCTVRATAAGLQGQLDVDSVSMTAKTFEIGIVDFDTPALTEPTSGDIFLVEIVVGNSQY
jgi:hypothetical protein